MRRDCPASAIDISDLESAVVENKVEVAVVQILVKDTGIGLPREECHRIFEAYHQVAMGARRKYKGLGLGLAITAEIVHMMGGSISVTSELGKGSTFRVRFPAYVVASSRTSAPPSRALFPSRPPTTWKRCLVFSRCPTVATNARVLATLLQVGRIDAGQPKQEGAAGLNSLCEACAVTASDLLIVEYHDEDREELPALCRKIAAMGAAMIVLTRAVGKHSVGQGDKDRYKMPRVSLCLPPWAPLQLAACAAKCQSRQASLATTAVSEEDAVLVSPHMPPEGECSQEESAGAMMRKCKVLLVDDEKLNLKVTSLMLGTLGCEVMTAQNGKKALEALRETGYDVVFMDYHMPEMDGCEAAKVITRGDFPLAGESSSPAPPIVGLSAAMLREDFDAMIASGMCKVLSKPASIEKLREMLAELQEEGLILANVSIPAAEGGQQ